MKTTIVITREELKSHNKDKLNKDIEKMNLSDKDLAVIVKLLYQVMIDSPKKAN